MRECVVSVTFVSLPSSFSYHGNNKISLWTNCVTVTASSNDDTLKQGEQSKKTTNIFCISRSICQLQNSPAVHSASK